VRRDVPQDGCRCDPGPVTAHPSAAYGPLVPPNGVPETASRVTTTVLLAVASVGAAVIAIFGEKGGICPWVIGSALAGLVPWALVAGGVALPPTWFALMAMPPVVTGVVFGNNPGSMFPAMIAIVWITRVATRWWLVVASIAVAFIAIALHGADIGSAHEGGLVYFAGGLGITFLAGLMLRRQEALTDELRSMHELRVAHATESERTRIAREVHDVVAHSLAVVMLHVTGARRSIASDPAGARAALGRAEEVGRDSLDSIRAVVGLLRDPSATGIDVPLPDGADIETLIDGYRSGGTSVSTVVDTDLSGLDAAAGLTVHRIVQESLANAVRHAPGAHCVVRVERIHADGARPELRMSVRNGPPQTSAARSSNDRATRMGLGLVGMGERARALGGLFRAGATADGGWEVVVTLPVPGMELGADDVPTAGHQRTDQHVERSSV
jgi:signal transduction histidine kinase